MALKLFKIIFFGKKRQNFAIVTQRCYVRHFIVLLKYVIHMWFINVNNGIISLPDATSYFQQPIKYCRHLKKHMSFLV